MKKIIAAIDGLKYSESTPKYAAHIAKQAHAHLVGVFLEDMTYRGYKFQEVAAKGSHLVAELDRLDEHDHEMRKLAVKNFGEYCQQAGLNYAVHHDRNIASNELLRESIYADLLVIDSHETLNIYEEDMPGRFLRDLLAEVQCPVLIVPGTYHPIEKLVLLYDGEPSSVYAIRTFSYIMPFLKHLETEVITVRKRDESSHLPEHRLMKEFMKRHFPDATYTVLKGLPEEVLPGYISRQPKESLVVLGAYRRGLVSRWFRPSMADVILESCQLPLFIAHNK